MLTLDHPQGSGFRVRVRAVPEVEPSWRVDRRSMTTSANPPYKQLRRTTDDKIIAGVCGGLGRYFGVDPVLMRVIFAVTVVLTGGLALFAYPVLWFLMPEDRQAGGAMAGGHRIGAVAGADPRRERLPAADLPAPGGPAGLPGAGGPAVLRGADLPDPGRRAAGHRHRVRHRDGHERGRRPEYGASAVTAGRSSPEVLPARASGPARPSRQGRPSREPTGWLVSRRAAPARQPHSASTNQPDGWFRARQRPHGGTQQGRRSARPSAARRARHSRTRRDRAAAKAGGGKAARQKRARQDRRRQGRWPARQQPVSPRRPFGPLGRGDRPVLADGGGYSHSMVPGGLLVTSRATRLTSGTSLVMRVEIRAITS